MNWPFIVRAAFFGILWGLWQAGSSIYVLDTWPTAFTWLKIGSASLVAFVGGCLTYSRDPEAALKASPLSKVVALVACLSAVSACTTLDTLKEVTLEDAQQSLVWSEEDQDLLASTCYSALVDILQTANLPNLHREPVGVLSTVYLARSVRRDIESLGTNSLRTKFLLGCAPLVSDQRDVLLKLGIKVAPLPLP